MDPLFHARPSARSSADTVDVFVQALESRSFRLQHISRIVPIPVVVGILARGKASPGRNTNRARRIGRIKSGTLLGDAIDIRSADQVIPIAAGDVPGMLIGHEKKDVRCFH